MQPPSGGCVLKQDFENPKNLIKTQPPSGGCVLKPTIPPTNACAAWAATFGWLCVET